MPDRRLDRGGKTTLARRLGARLCLPVHQVDPVQWLPGWERAPAGVIAAAHEQWLAQPAWIIDGWGSWPALPCGSSGRRPSSW